MTTGRVEQEYYFYTIFNELYSRFDKLSIINGNFVENDELLFSVSAASLFFLIVI